MSKLIATDAQIQVITIGLSPAINTVLFTYLKPIQVVGFVPMTDCNEQDCRYQDITCCYVNRVFGEVISGVATQKSTYENDFSTFLLNNAFYYLDHSTTITFKLEKNINGVWTFITNLSGTYGTAYPNGSFPNANMSGQAINWGTVYKLHGAGVYRVKAINSYTPPSVPISPFPVPYPGGVNPDTINNCLISEPFKLMAWNCNIAHGTVKFESSISGKIGDIRKDYLIHDLCGVVWFDSIRMPAFFGFETDDYNEILQEWGKPTAGKIVRVRDEAIQKYELRSNLIPQYILSRFSVYGLMADILRVSDYNINNANWDIKQMGVVKNGGFAPEYKNAWPNNINGRTGTVKMNFKRNPQNVISSRCC